MSTRSSIWLGEADGKTVHIYWELAERENDGGKTVAPIYICVDEGDSSREVKSRLPKEVAETILAVLCPDYKSRFGTEVG